MKQWTVIVEGLGGYHAEFHQRTYIVSAESAGEAVDRAAADYALHHAKDSLGIALKFHMAKVYADEGPVRVIA